MVVVSQYISRTMYIVSGYVVDVLWGQLIKLIQVASTSELCENQRPSFLLNCSLSFLRGLKSTNIKLVITGIHPKKFRAIFLIIEIRGIFAVNSILKI